MFGWVSHFMRLPYFKFQVSEWLLGDIFFEDLETQGLFINVCALYWQKGCVLSIEDIEKRLETDRLAKLTDRFISVSDGFISIKFLDEQKAEFSKLSKVNSANGKKGGRPKTIENTGTKTERLANGKRTESETKAKKSNIDKIREEKKRVISTSFTDSILYDRNEFAKYFEGWNKEKLKYYYDAADNYSAQGNKYIDWGKAIRNWATKDEASNKQLAFNQKPINYDNVTW